MAFSRNITGLTLLSACAGMLAAQGQPTSSLKTTVIRFYAPVTEDTVGRLLNAVDAKLKEGTKRFDILISSPGGSVFAGLSAYHYLRGIPAEVITHNFGSADSIATVMFCAGSTRYSVPQGRFLLHGVSSAFPPNVQLEEGNVDQTLKLMHQEVASIASVIAETTHKPLSEVQSAIADRTVLTSEEAQKWGLVTGIREELYRDGADLVSIAENAPPTQQRLPQIAYQEVTFTTNTVMPSSEPTGFFTATPDFSTRHEEIPTQPSNLGSPKLDLRSPLP